MFTIAMMTNHDDNENEVELSSVGCQVAAIYGGGMIVRMMSVMRLILKMRVMVRLIQKMLRMITTLLDKLVGRLQQFVAVR